MIYSMGGEAKVAKVGLTANPSGLDFTAEVFLSSDKVVKNTTSGSIGFLATGVPQVVNAPIVTPTAPGEYFVILEVSVGDQVIFRHESPEKVLVQEYTVTGVSVTWE